MNRASPSPAGSGPGAGSGAGPHPALRLHPLAPWLLAANAVLLWLGLSLDAVTVAKTMTKEVLVWELRLVDERATYSILGAIGKLWDDGSRGLFLLVGFFSVVFPVAKWSLAAAAVVSRWRGHEGPAAVWARRLGALGKWSMLEVFMAALLCALLKMGDLVRVKVEAGLYCFGAAVLASVALAAVLRR